MGEHNFDNHEDNLEIVEGSGLFDSTQPGEQEVACDRCKGKGWINDSYGILPMGHHLDCPDCGGSGTEVLDVEFQPPTSDQIRSILSHLDRQGCFSYTIDHSAVIFEYSGQTLCYFDKGPLSHQLLAALAWLVTYKLDELKSIMEN